MALTAIADTSVLKRLGRPPVRAAVEPLVLRGAIGRARISDLEVGYSARNGTEWDLLVGALAAFEIREVTSSHLVRALQVQRLLADRSHRGRTLPDLLIAAVAESEGVAVLHYDVDFELIGEVTGQRTTWVVPPGSVD